MTINEALPPWMRYDLACVNVNCLWPGPKEPHDMQPLTDIFIDEMVYGYFYGYKVTDSSKPTCPAFNAKQYLLSTLFDQPALAHNMRRAAHGSHAGACGNCHQEGHSIEGIKKNAMYTGQCPKSVPC